MDNNAHVNDKAQAAYAAYAKSTGGKTWDGRDMPTYEALPANIQKAWYEAADAAYRKGCDEQAEILREIEAAGPQHSGGMG